MGRRRPTPEQWREAVYKSQAITDAVRVVLLLLADYMRQDRTVSVPRATIANKLGRTERRISQRIADAHHAGFLDTISKGYRGSTAVYVGTFPDPERVTVSSTLLVSKSVTLSTLERVPPGGPTISTADLSASPHRLNSSTYEEHLPSTAASRLPCLTCADDGCADCEGVA